jgi:hypothetical protein
MIEDNPSQNQLEGLWKLCAEFIDEEGVSCPEAICDMDNVIINAYGLIKDMANIVGYKETLE